MAVWQFRFSLLQRKDVLRKHRVLPEFLMEYKANFNRSSSSLDESSASYWKRVDIEALSSCLQRALPVVESWDDELAIYGYKNGTRIEISEDEAYVKMDARNPDYTFLRKVVDVAKSFDCIFIIEENGRLIEPEFTLLLESLQNSRAYRFCEDPDKVLAEIRKGYIAKNI